MGLGLITIYRVTELLSPGLQEYQNVLAFFISLFFAWAAWLTRKQLLAQRRMAEKLREMAHSNDPLEVEPTKLSHQLAEVMNNFHDHIEYYEVKADEHHFPKYEEQMTLNAK